MLLRIALGHATGTPLASWRTRRAAAGRPIVTDGPRTAGHMRVSLAHSGPYLVATTSARGPVAVDLEVIRERRCAGIARYLGWPEHIWLRGLEVNAFFYLWTLWEAAIKLASARVGIAAAELFADLVREIDAGCPAPIRIGALTGRSWLCAERFWVTVLAENTDEMRLFHVRSWPSTARHAEIDEVDAHYGSLAPPVASDRPAIDRPDTLSTSC